MNYIASLRKYAIWVYVQNISILPFCSKVEEKEPLMGIVDQKKSARYNAQNDDFFVLNELIIDV